VKSSRWASRVRLALRRAPLIALLLAAFAVAGCGSQSPLDTHSDQASDIATLWWVMLAIAAVVFLGAVALLTLGAVRRTPRGLPLLGERENAFTGLVVVFGICIPALVLIPLFAIANLGVLPDTDAPKASSTKLTIRVIGHQWFWEVRYPGSTAVTANEIHIPARTRVNVVAETHDVIHSFWVPQLNRKIDMLPGHPNRVLLYADQPGRYRGQCAEFCGLQHAHMSLSVYADPPGRFRAWLAHMATPRTSPRTPGERRGEQVFMSNQCASCHAIRGTAARGRVGPDLTHLETRATLAALTIPNRRVDLDRWIHDPQDIKPGANMPALKLSTSEWRSVLAYLESLR
jgi:cytochrome c oxidase subunit II